MKSKIITICLSLLVGALIGTGVVWSARGIDTARSKIITGYKIPTIEERIINIEKGTNQIIRHLKVIK